MDTPTTSLVIGGAALAVLLVVVALVVVLLVGSGRTRRSLAAQVAELQAGTTELRARLAALEAAVPPRTDAEQPDRDDVLVPEVLPGGEPDDAEGVAVPDQLVLSATLGEPLLRAAALGHGVRRALSAESRNRIWFEVRREVRRSRKRRRQDLKAARRHLQRQPAADLGEL